MDEKEKFEKLYSKVEKIESLLEKIIKDGTVQFVNIENLNLEGPLQEYSFDKIDVDQVSGALNLGNNLGISVDGSKQNKNVKPSSQKKSKSSQKNEVENTTSHNRVDKKDSNKTENSKIEKQIEDKLQEISPKHSVKEGEMLQTATKLTNNQKSEQTAPNREGRDNSKQESIKNVKNGKYQQLTTAKQERDQSKDQLGKISNAIKTEKKDTKNSINQQSNVPKKGRQNSEKSEVTTTSLNSKVKQSAATYKENRKYQNHYDNVKNIKNRKDVGKHQISKTETGFSIALNGDDQK